jgi:UDP-galactopyranose mutase
MDCIVVGCGFVGSVAARYLAEKNLKVLVLERRNHIAGNMYDYKRDNGILVHKYGPHTFHTNKRKLYDYVCKFGNWFNFKLECMVNIDGIFTPSPFNFQTIDDFFEPDRAEQLKKSIMLEFKDTTEMPITNLLTSENALIREFANFLFEKDYKLYTAKQWGIPPEEIDISVLKRVPVRFSYETGYFNDKYQIMPEHGYTHFFSNMLDHPNISLELNTDARKYLRVDADSMEVLFNNTPVKMPIIYTGAIDELLDNKFGALPYRSLRFELKDIQADSYQNVPIVAYPQAEGFTRITEYKKLPVQNVRRCTTIAVEYPIQHEPGCGTEQYYPIPTERNIERYEKYRSTLADIKNIFLCGRLAEYKYYNMDQVLERALDLCDVLNAVYSLQ